MSNTLLIIITGLSCSGKTTFGKRLARELRLPFINKDGIKELLFDNLGWKDRAWSKKLGQATYPILFYFVETLLAAGYSHIVESNFSAELASEKFLELKKQYGFEPFQIQCVTNGEVLFQRFKERSETGERHPGHRDHLNYEEFKAGLLRGRDEPLDIGETIVEVDTTDFEVMDYKKLIELIRARMNET
jgi:predicted kinase